MPSGPTDAFAVLLRRARQGICSLTIQGLFGDAAPVRRTAPRRTSAESIPSYRAMADMVHANGAKIFAQIHYSRVGNGWRYEQGSPVAPLFGPSAVQIFDDFHVTHEMSVKTIKAVIEAHKISAGHLREASYDGVQVHCAHAMLCEAFLSPYFNHRTDEWVGSLEIGHASSSSASRPRAKARLHLAVGTRYNVDEMVSGGLDQSDTPRDPRAPGGHEAPRLRGYGHRARAKPVPLRYAELLPRGPRLTERLRRRRRSCGFPCRVLSVLAASRTSPRPRRALPRMSATSWGPRGLMAPSRTS